METYTYNGQEYEPIPPTREDALREFYNLAVRRRKRYKEQGKNLDELTEKALKGEENALRALGMRSKERFLEVINAKQEDGTQIFKKGDEFGEFLLTEYDQLELLLKVSE